MEKQFRELRERLLRAGVAPRHVRRYVTELNDHLSDLIAEEKRAGRSPDEAQAAALVRLGRTEDLARTMVERPGVKSWSARAPWAVLGLGSVAALGCAWTAALWILWSGWNWFLAGATTPFGVRTHGFVVYYFGLGRSLYYWAPFLVGWGLVVLAGRQRLKAAWPVLTLAVLALVEAPAMVKVSRPDMSRPGHVSMSLLAGLENLGVGVALMHAAVLFGLTAAPYFVWGWWAARADGAYGTEI
jgi:hypothetical protein